MKNIIFIFLAITTFLSAKPNIVFVHGLGSDSNTFLKMASTISSEIGQKDFMKWGFQHTFVNGAYCWTYDVDVLDWTDDYSLCSSGTDGFLLFSGDTSYYTSKNTFARVYGLDDNDFEMNKIYFRYLDTNHTYNSYDKFETAPSSEFYSMNSNSNFYQNINGYWILNENWNSNDIYQYLEYNSSFYEKPSVHILNLSNNINLTFQAQGKELGYLLLNIAHHTNNRDFILVGHSMGGLAIRSLIQDFDFDELNLNVSNIITIGSPHRGAGVTSSLSLLTEVFGDGEAPHNLTSDSEAIANLNDFNSSLYSNINFSAFVSTGHTGFFIGDENDIVSGSNDDGIVSTSSQIPPNYIADEVLYFSPDCTLYSNCVSTNNAIHHTKETGNDYIIEEVTTRYLNSIIENNETDYIDDNETYPYPDSPSDIPPFLPLIDTELPKEIFINQGWNLVAVDMNITDIPEEISIIWKWSSDENWLAFSPSGEHDSKIYELNISLNHDYLYSNRGTWLLSNSDFWLELPEKNNDSLEPPTVPNFSGEIGWNLMGTDKDIPVNILSCKDSSLQVVWKFVDNEWKFYVSDVSIYKYDSMFETIYSNEGFWLLCN
jgi:hypothetical protein